MTQTIDATIQSTEVKWAEDALFYHVYPLGLCGAPARQDEQMVPRLRQLHDWIPYWQELGVTALYLGPVMAAMSHGYDPVDFFRLDPRLGETQDLRELIQALHQAGIRVVLDGVFHHVGRDFFAFNQLSREPESALRDWFFLKPGRSAYGDDFEYDCWEGHNELVKLNLNNPELRAHLLEAVSFWITELGIDGLRLDVAYCLEPDFVAALADHCRQLKPDFWLMGEIIHGDYRPLLKQLDSVTNYEVYKGLWSSHFDGNYFEIAHSLQRQFGPGGIYAGRKLYNFADNHDVDRVLEKVKDPDQLFPLYLLLMTLPGIPSLYHGSELALAGRKNAGDDAPLRPAIDFEDHAARAQGHPLLAWIQALSRLRRDYSQLRTGNYAPVSIRNRQFAFLRGDCLVALNLDADPVNLKLDDLPVTGWYQDALDPGWQAELSTGNSIALPASRGRLLVPVNQ